MTALGRRWAADAVRKPLFRHVVSPFSARVLRPGSTAARRRLEAFEWLDPEAVRQAQWSSLGALLRHAAATVPYYRRTFAELGLGPNDFAAPGSPGEAPRPRLTPDDFARLPILSKPTVRKEFPDGLVSEHRGHTWLPWRRPKVFRTSGTTGMPLRFYRDPALRAHDHATRVWQYAWAGLQPGDQVTYMRGTVYVSPWLYPFWSFFGGARHFPSHLYLGRDGEGIARVLDLWRPDGLIGHPPSLTLAAHALRAAGRRLRHPPKGIIVGGEIVGRRDWRLMREAFGSPVHVGYGANEFGIHVAQSCPDRVARGEPPYENLHISALRFLVETVDDDGRPVEPGRTTSGTGEPWPPNPARAGEAFPSWKLFTAGPPRLWSCSPGDADRAPISVASWTPGRTRSGSTSSGRRPSTTSR